MLKPLSAVVANTTPYRNEPSMKPIHPDRLKAIFSVTCALLLCLSAATVRADKTDVVVLLNGNAVTGEITSLEFGKLRYSTDSMGTVQIDWEDVVAVTSNQALQLEITDGRRYFGGLRSSEERFQVTVQTASREVVLATEDVIRITPIEVDERFWQRLEGSVSFGLNANKGSEVATLNINADVRYRAREYLVGVTARTTITDQPSEPTTTSQRLTSNYQRFRGNRWFTDWFTSWERNDATGIDSRLSLGGALGRYFVQTNFNQFSILAGVQATRESQFGVEDSDKNAEGRVQFRYLHRNLEPDTSFTLTSDIYPLLEDLSQFRSFTNLSFRREFIDDLFLDLSIYHEFQTESVEGAELTDYGVTSSLGYSF